MADWDPYGFRRRKAARLGAGTRRSGTKRFESEAPYEVNVANQEEGFDRGGVVTLRRSSPGYEGKVSKTRVGDTKDSWERGVNGESHPFYDHRGRPGRNPATSSVNRDGPKPRGLKE